MKFAVSLTGWYGGSKYTKSPFLASFKIDSKSLHEILIFSDCKNLLTVSKILQSSNLEFFCRDFEQSLHDIKKGDFVYFDPPYQPVSNTANFTSYTNRHFTEQDLQRLADLADRLDSKGCKVMLSNSQSKKVEKLFSSSKWKIKKITAKRAINSDTKNRTGHFEILIKNY